MEKVLRVIGPVVVLAAIGAAIWIVVMGALAEPAIVGSLVTVFGAIAAAGYQQWLQRRDAMKEARREQLSPMYDGLTRVVRTIGDDSKSTTQRKAEQSLGTFQDKLLIWGPPALIRAWADAMRTFERDPESAEAVLAYAGILREIRRELGHDDAELDARDLLRLFVSDIDAHIPAGLKLDGRWAGSADGSAERQQGVGGALPAASETASQSRVGDTLQ